MLAPRNRLTDSHLLEHLTYGALRQLTEVDAAAAEGKAPEHGVHLDIVTPGDIGSFFWAHSRAPPPGLVECDVAYGARRQHRNP